MGGFRSFYDRLERQALIGQNDATIVVIQNC